MMLLRRRQSCSLSARAAAVKLACRPGSPTLCSALPGSSAEAPLSALDYDSLIALRNRPSPWRLLASLHAPLIVAVFHKVFVAPNIREVGEADLAEALEDQLYTLRERGGADAYPRTAREYLDEWAEPDRNWLRKYYRPGSDETQYDLTPAAEKAIAWVASLTERSFVGTESRLLTLFSLLEQIGSGTEADPARRLEELRRRRDALDAEIARAEAGEVPLLGDTAVRDRFQQFQHLARELLADFREVEHNFRQLDRKVRERITLWDGSKGALLEEVLGDRDAIADSDEGRSFRAFWEFLMSSQRQEALSQRLDQVLSLPAIAALAPEPRLRRVHHDWLEAGGHTQRMVALLSQQLRRFLDDRAVQENRRITGLLRSIEAHALALRNTDRDGPGMDIAGMGADIVLPMERPLFTPPVRVQLADTVPVLGLDDIDLARLYDRRVVDKARLTAAIATALRHRPQLTLRDLLQDAPLQEGLAELVAYLDLAHRGGGDDEAFRAAVDGSVEDTVTWDSCDQDGVWVERQARIPRLIFSR